MDHGSIGPYKHLALLNLAFPFSPKRVNCAVEPVIWQSCNIISNPTMPLLFLSGYCLPGEPLPQKSILNVCKLTWD